MSSKAYPAAPDRMDDILDQQVGRGMMDATGPGGAMDLINYGVFGKITRGIFGRGGAGQLGTKRTTRELLDEGLQASDDRLDPKSAEEILESVREIDETATLPDIAPTPEGAPETPVDLPPGLTPEEQAARLAARQAEDLERRTWERNVNLDYIQEPQEIGGILDANAELIPTAPREALGQIEADVEGNVEQIMGDVLTGGATGNLSSRQLLAGRRMLITLVDRVDDLKNKIIAGKATSEDKLQFEKYQTQAIMLQKYMQGQIRETGRALNSMKIVARTINGSDVEALANMAGVQNASIEAKARILQDLQDQGDTQPKDLLDTYDDMSRFGQALSSIVSYWTASILSGFKTQIVNATSNSMMQFINTVAVRPVAAGLSPLRRKLTGDTQGVEFAEVAAELVGFRQGFRDGLMMAGRVFKQGTFENRGEYVSSFGGRKIDDVARDGTMVSEAIGVDRIPVLSHLFNFVQRSTEAASFGLLTAGDEFFKAMAYRKSLYGQSVRQALSEDLEGQAALDRANELLNDVSQRMHDEALAEAERLTFTNDAGGFMGMIANDIASWTHKLPALKFIFPFIRTPVALLDRTIKMSPLAPIQQEFRDRVAQGGAGADVAIAEMTFGTSIFALAAMLYHEGSLTGAGPDDYNQRRALDKLGWQANSIRIGDRYLAYNRGLDPLGMSIGAMATMLDRMSYDQREPEISDWAVGTIFALAKYFTELPYMQGLANVIALIDGKRDFEKEGARMLASFVPSFTRDVEAVRRGFAEEEANIQAIYPHSGFWSMLNGYLDQRVPGNIGATLPPLRYWDGSIVTAGAGNALYLYNSLSPIKAQIGKNDMPSQRLAANGIRVTPPTSTISIVPEMGIKLDILTDLENGNELYDKLLQMVGEARRKRVTMLINNKQFKKLDSGPGSEQAIELERQIQQGGRDGKMQFLEYLIKEKPTVEEYGEKAILLNKGDLRRLLNSMKRGRLTPAETEILREADTKGVATRQELYVPEF